WWGADVVLKCLDGAFADVLSCYSTDTDASTGEVSPGYIIPCPAGIAAQDECTNATTKLLAYSVPTIPPAPTTTTLKPTPAPTVAPKTTAPVTTAPKTTAPKTTAPLTTTPTTTPFETRLPSPSPTTPVPTPTRTPLTTLVPVPSVTDPQADVEIWVKFFYRNARCAVFGEAGCEYCASAKALLESKNASYDYFGVWLDNPNHIPDGMEVYNALVDMTKQDTLPNIWIGNVFVGGSDDIHALDKAGKLDQMLKDAKCIK
ncbi:hypothetical protein As57867_006158, partial [Aphanomyces stellatus]